MAFDLMSWLSGKPTQVADSTGGIAGQWGQGENSFMKNIVGLLNQYNSLNDDAGRSSLAAPQAPQGQSPSQKPQQAQSFAMPGAAMQQRAMITGQPAHSFGAENAKGEAHNFWSKAFGMPNPLGKVEYKEQTPNGGTWSFKMDPTENFLKLRSGYNKDKMQ